MIDDHDLAVSFHLAVERFTFPRPAGAFLVHFQVLQDLFDLYGRLESCAVHLTMPQN